MIWRACDGGYDGPLAGLRRRRPPRKVERRPLAGESTRVASNLAGIEKKDDLTRRLALLLTHRIHPEMRSPDALSSWERETPT
eukprot:6987669-Prymnesium_polylepis.1